MLIARETSLNPVLKQWMLLLLLLLLLYATKRCYDSNTFWDQDYRNRGSMPCAWQRTVCIDSIPTISHNDPGESTLYRRPSDYEGVVHASWAAALLDATKNGGGLRSRDPKEETRR